MKKADNIRNNSHRLYSAIVNANRAGIDEETADLEKFQTKLTQLQDKLESLPEEAEERKTIMAEIQELNQVIELTENALTAYQMNSIDFGDDYGLQRHT